MTLHTLESRFASRVNAIYAKFSNPEALSEIKPNSPESRSRIKSDSQLLPVVSTIRDAKLIGKFLKSTKGVLFLGKQTLLQTGNTFAETRLYNPLGALIHTVPTIHATRHVGIPSKFSIASLSNPTRDNRGALQRETVVSLTQNQNTGFIKNITRGLVNTVLSPFRALITTQNYTRPEDEAFKEYGPMLPTAVSKTARGNVRGVPYPTTKSGGQIDNNIQPRFEITNKGNSNTGFLTNLQIVQGRLSGVSRTNGLSNQTYSFTKPYVNGMVKNESKFVIRDSRPSTSISSTVTSGPLSQAVSADAVNTQRYASSRVSNTTSLTTAAVRDGGFTLADISKLSPQFDEQYKNYGLQTIDGQVATGANSKTPTFLGLIQSQKPYFEYAKKFTDGYELGDNQGIAKDEDKRYKSTIQDAFNRGTTGNTEGELNALVNNRVVYTSIIRTDEKEAQEGKSDIIRFIFRSVDESDPVHFRAFISSLTETVHPEFSEQKYLGRTERFVTYAGAKRSVSLNFNIVAFSVGEIDNIWVRMNYITGLAFPKGVSASGFMIPPLFRITIGKIYENQPCYIETLETELLDDKTTFDIDEEVSKIINVKMTLSLLEKTSRFYNSPFYAISEKIIAKELYLRNPPTMPASLVQSLNSITTTIPDPVESAKQRATALNALRSIDRIGKFDV